MSTITQIIDPFQIATLGITSSNPLTIATDGFIVFITEEIIEVGGPGGGKSSNRPGPTIFPPRSEVKKKKKRITAVVFINGVEYKETIELDDISITAKDIKIEISNAAVPQIKLTVTRG